MTGVLGMLDLALAGDLAAEQRKFIAMAQTSGRSLIRIINDILDLTKIEMGKLSLEEKPFLLRKCLASTYNLFLPVARGKGLNLSLTVADEVPETLVGDQARISQILKALLQRSNYDLDFVDNGQKAVEMWESGEYDLILMDVQMPRLNGFEATAAIREKEHSRGGHIPIIAMTAHALKEDEERCLAAGMDAYISKPIDFQKTQQVIGEILKLKTDGSCK